MRKLGEDTAKFAADANSRDLGGTVETFDPFSRIYIGYIENRHISSDALLYHIFSKNANP